MGTYLLEKMTWPEVEEALKTVELAVLPVGSTEQHGSNTTFDTDTARAREFCRLLAEELPDKVLVGPVIPIGIAFHHMSFPGTLTVQPETLLQYLTDVAWSFKQHGLQKLLFINGHGGNRTVLDLACTKVLHELDMQVGWVGIMTDTAGDVMAEKVDSDIYGHGCEVETSQLLYLHPESVRESALEPAEVQDALYNKKWINMPYRWHEISAGGALGDATKSSYELGQAVTETALKRIVGAIEQQFGVSR